MKKGIYLTMLIFMLIMLSSCGTVKDELNDVPKNNQPANSITDIESCTITIFDTSPDQGEFDKRLTIKSQVENDANQYLENCMTNRASDWVLKRKMVFRKLSR